MNVHQLSPTFTNVHQLSLTFTNFHLPLSLSVESIVFESIVSRPLDLLRVQRLARRWSSAAAVATSMLLLLLSTTVLLLLLSTTVLLLLLLLLRTLLASKDLLSTQTACD